VVALDKRTGGRAWHGGGSRTMMRRVGFKINTLAAVSRRAAAASTVRDAGVVVNGDGGGGGCGGGAAAATTMTTTRDGCRLVNFCPQSDRHAC